MNLVTDIFIYFVYLYICRGRGCHKECTITLENVALHLGLHVHGKPMTTPTYFDYKDMCHTYLGVAPLRGDAIVGSVIKLKSLHDNM